MIKGVKISLDVFSERHVKTAFPISLADHGGINKGGRIDGDADCKAQDMIEINVKSPAPLPYEIGKYRYEWHDYSG